MSEMQTLVGEMNWAMRNMAYNLDFIPDDKLNWKPAPTALSALEAATRQEKSRSSVINSRNEKSTTSGAFDEQLSRNIVRSMPVGVPQFGAQS